MNQLYQHLRLKSMFIPLVGLSSIGRGTAKAVST